MTIDEIDRTLPNGFHDAKLKNLRIDYVQRRASMELDVLLSLDSNQSRQVEYRRCQLEIFDLHFFVVEPPDSVIEMKNVTGLWIDKTQIGEEVFRRLFKAGMVIPEGFFCCSFFVFQWNSCIYFCAKEATISFD